MFDNLAAEPSGSDVFGFGIRDALISMTPLRFQLQPARWTASKCSNGASLLVWAI
jgi:hypothetical protein